jgi:hypothetical protein
MSQAIRHRALTRLILAALLMAIGFYLPMLTGQIPQLGSALLPMHLPVLMCGYICGGPYGLLIGGLLPILRSLFFGMPPMFPTAIAMAFELAAYGVLTGVLYRLLPKKPWGVYVSLILSMLGGRIVWGAAQVALLGLSADGFSLAAFWTGGFADALPGIIVQLVLIPPLVLALRRAGLLTDAPRSPRSAP